MSDTGTRAGEAFNVRLATLADIPVVARQRASMFRDMGALADDLVEPLVAATSSFLAAAIPAGEYIGWLASPAGDPGEVIGGAGLQLRRALPRPMDSGRRIALGPQGLVLNVYTEPAWRRRGAAERLMRHVLAWVRANAVDGLVLHASADGRPLYERLGFVPTNEMRYDRDLGDGR